MTDVVMVKEAVVHPKKSSNLKTKKYENGDPLLK